MHFYDHFRAAKVMPAESYRPSWKTAFCKPLFQTIEDGHQNRFDMIAWAETNVHKGFTDFMKN